jgi:hypothetical protein
MRFADLSIRAKIIAFMSTMALATLSLAIISALQLN